MDRKTNYKKELRQMLHRREIVGLVFGPLAFGFVSATWILFGSHFQHTTDFISFFGLTIMIGVLTAALPIGIFYLITLNDNADIFDVIWHDGYLKGKEDLIDAPANMIYSPYMGTSSKKMYGAMVINKDKYLGEEEGMPKLFNTIDVYLVNESGERCRVKVLTGAFSSMDEDLMETGKRVSDPVVLEAHSAFKIGTSDTGELDFVVWFNLDITDEEGRYSQYVFSLPKPYNWDKYTTMVLPFIGEEGMILPLKIREGGSIEDYVQGKGLAPKYFENVDGKMVQKE